MKKIDKLIIQAFLGPFILTFAVVVFILLTVQMMNYVDQIFGKDLSYFDLGVLVMHFAIFQTPIAFPLSVMLASLMTFGNLGEHFELTAIKSAGISLIRAMQPIFIIVIFITIIAFFSNNYLVPHSALKAYSLLYDIRQKKPALDIEPGLFYGGIENYKIKVDKKLSDGKTLLGVIIYNHSDKNGNREVTVADSGKMYTILNDQYLKFELFNGAHYTEENVKNRRGRLEYQYIDPFTRTFFKKSEIIFDLSSFGMSRTDEGLFASNRLMRNFNQLNSDLDSLSRNIILAEGEVYSLPTRYFTYSSIKKGAQVPEYIQEVKDEEDSIRKAKALEAREESAEKQKETLTKNDSSKRVLASSGNAIPTKKELESSKPAPFKLKSKVPTVAEDEDEVEEVQEDLATPRNRPEIISEASRENVIETIEKRYQNKSQRTRILKSALATARQAKSKLTVQNSRIEQLNKDYFEFDIQWHKMLATAIACLSMFLIGAPLGAIIKRGGLGFPVLVSILFFIIYYVISIGGEKYAKSGILPVFQGVWAANIILFPIGLFFLRQARNDARLFELDYYKVAFSNFIIWIKKKLGKAS
ncbi:MAG: LptF/LptG family permease [Cyclobacteriaceae bacterium]|nr:LptF/LptG family permease [Cyclobacteriaceae bacterium]